LSPIRVCLIFFFLSALGMALIPALSVDVTPATTPASFTIFYSLPGASPEVTEAEATAPIEGALAQLSGIRRIRSSSFYHAGRVEIDFVKGLDVDFKRFEILSILRNLYPKLNPAITYPIVENVAAGARRTSPLLTYSICGALTTHTLEALVRDKLLAPISQLKEVREVSLSGSVGHQLTILYDPAVLEQKGIRPAQLSEALQRCGVGHHFQRQRALSAYRFSVTLPNALEALEAIRGMVIASGGQQYRLEELASVYIEEQKPQSYHRLNGLNAISLEIYAEDHLNRMVATAAIKERVRAAARTLPAGISILTEHDDTAYLQEEVQKNATRSILSCVLLFVFVMVVYRKLSLIGTMVVSMVVTLGLIALLAWFFDVQMHLYTFAGLSVACSLVLNNLVLLLDHLRRGQEQPFFRSMLATTLTMAAALSVVFFLPEEERINLAEFSIILVLSLVASAGSMFFFVPVVYRLWTKNMPPAKRSYRKLRRNAKGFRFYQRAILATAGHKRKLVVLSVLAFGLPVFLLPTRWEGHAWYNQTLGNEWYVHTVKPWVDRGLGGALRLFFWNGYDRSVDRDMEKTKLTINAKLPNGFTLEDMNHVMQEVEAYLSTFQGLEKYITHVYTSEYGVITVFFKKEYENGSLPYVLERALINFSLDKGGVTWEISGVGKGFSNAFLESAPSFRVDMRGYHYDELERQAGVLASKLKKHSRVQKVDINKQLSWSEKQQEQLTLRVNTEALAAKGVKTDELVAQLRDASPQLHAGFSLMVDGDQLPVYVESASASLFSKRDAQIRSHVVWGKAFPMAAFNALTTETKNSAIHREERQYLRVVGFEYFGNHRFGDEYLKKVLLEMKAAMPVGYSAKQIDEGWSWAKVRRQYGLLALLFFVLYLLNGVLFESLRTPWLILAIIPMSFIGLFLSFGLFEFYFDQGGYAAFLLLGGMVASTVIVILSDATAGRGKNKSRCYIKATWINMGPIVFTVVSTCAGFIPFMMHGQREVFWFSLAMGTGGGLLASLVAVFIICPVLYTRRRRDYQLK
jgi:multidrug efflux pump subunit AcrB